MADEREPTARDMAIAQMVDEIDRDPDTRGELRGVIAKKYPRAAEMMPETAVRKAVEPELQALRKERELLAADRKADANRRGLESLHAKFSALGVAPADYTAVETFMNEHLTADPDLAVMGWREAKRIATPSPSRGWGVTVPGAKGSGTFFTKSPQSGISIADDWQKWRGERARKDFADLEAGRPLDPVDA